jgi:PAS domain S-box-containing protein
VSGRNGSSKARPLARGGRAKVLRGMLVAAVTRPADAGFLTDPDGRIILWSDAAEAILGYPRDDALGRRCCDLLRGDDLNGDTPRAYCAKGGHAQRTEPMPTWDLRTRTKAGLSIWLNVSILLLCDREHDGPFALHLFREVTTTPPLPPTEAGLTADSPGHANGALTQRECEVLSLIGEGLKTRAIAERLHLSWATVRNHAQNILLKLNVHSRLEAVAYARRHRVL